MTYTVSYQLQFRQELQRMPRPEQMAVATFITTYQTYGLGNQTKLVGRLSPSWHGLPINHPNYQFARKFDLWHYHIGLPYYSGRQEWDRVSDWLLHFQWVGRGDHISLVDLYQHHRDDGSFYLPAASRLEDQPPEA